MTIGERFDGAPNALNAIRLGLACQVITWHAYALTGNTWLPAGAERFCGDIAVDGFFAISGFLIVRSWRHSTSARYVLSRGARILPGLWGCLMFTAFVLAPLVSNSSDGDKARFLVYNWLVWPGHKGIGGTLADAWAPYNWMGTMWSLRYEVLCYILVLVLGSFAALRSRVAGWTFLLLAWSLALAVMRNGTPHWASVSEVSRTTLIFSCGAMLYAYRDSVPLRRDIGIGAAVLVAASVVALPDYRIAAAPAVAYLMLAGGLWLGRYPALRLRNDLSYGTYIYGLPIQQSLLAAGVSLPFVGFAALSLVCTLPVAAVSWFVVERPALLWARRSNRTGLGQPTLCIEHAAPVAVLDAPVTKYQAST